GLGSTSYSRYFPPTGRRPSLFWNTRPPTYPFGGLPCFKTSSRTALALAGIFGFFLKKPLHSFQTQPAFFPIAPNAFPTPQPAAEHAAFLAISFPVSFINW